MASALEQSGVSVPLAHNPLKERAEDNPSPFEHTMNRGFSTDTYKVSYYGYAHSQIDALCHSLYKDQTYNGYARAEVNTETGCTKLGIEHLKNGIVTRGILIDMPRLKGVPYLEPGTPIYVEDLEAWEKQAGIRVGPGDALFIRTGRWVRRAKLGPSTNAEAGLDASVIPWLKQRDVAVIGSEAALSVTPIPSTTQITDPDDYLPLHNFVLVILGMNVFDDCDLTSLSEAAA